MELRTTKDLFSIKKKGGRNSYERRVGIHGRTAEQMTKDGRKGGVAGGRIGGLRSVEARGLTLWSDEEKEFAYQLSLSPEYQRGSKTKRELIALELNRRYHDNNKVRNSRAVGRTLEKYKKSLVDMVE